MRYFEPCITESLITESQNCTFDTVPIPGLRVPCMPKHGSALYIKLYIHFKR